MHNYEMNNFISILMLALLAAVAVNYALRGFQQEKKRTAKAYYFFMPLGALIGICLTPYVAKVVLETYQITGKDAGIGVYYLSALFLSVIGALTSMIIYSYIKNRKKKE